MRHKVLLLLQALFCVAGAYIRPSFPYNNAIGGVKPGFNKQVHCRLPPQTGSCNWPSTVYYFDANTGRCHSMVYRGCGGNENRFSSEIECLLACTGIFQSGYHLTPNSWPQNNQVFNPFTMPTSPNNLLRGMGIELPQAPMHYIGNELQLPQAPVQAIPTELPQAPAHYVVQRRQLADNRMNLDCYQPRDLGCDSFRGSYVLLRFYFSKQSGTCVASYYCWPDKNFGGFDTEEECIEECLEDGRWQITQNMQDPSQDSMSPYLSYLPVVTTTQRPITLQQSGPSDPLSLYETAPLGCGNSETLARFVSIRQPVQCAEFCEYRPAMCHGFIFDTIKMTCTLKMNCSSTFHSLLDGEYAFRRKSRSVQPQPQHPSWQQHRPIYSSQQQSQYSVSNQPQYPPQSQYGTFVELIPRVPTMSPPRESPRRHQPQIYPYYTQTQRPSTTTTPMWYRLVDWPAGIRPPVNSTFPVTWKYQSLGYYCGGELIKRINKVYSKDDCAQLCNDYQPPLRSQPLCYAFTYSSYRQICDLQVNCMRRDGNEGTTWIIRSYS